MVERLRSRGAPIAVSCLLHLGLATSLVVRESCGARLRVRASHVPVGS